MALDVQVDMYSVDTGNFYSNHEKYLHNMNCKYRKERNYVKNQLPEIEKELQRFGLSKKDISNIKNDHIDLVDIQVFDDIYDVINKYILLNNLIRHKRKKAKESKNKLTTLLSNKVIHNERTNGSDHIRILREESISDENTISMFESSLTRAIGIKKDAFTEDLITVQIYYFDVFKDMIYYGFMYKGEKYIYFSSSAGQIRTKKGVFIKESVWNRIEKTITCGLTNEKINEKGGNNVNKHLAYLALSNSATDEWIDFDIDKTIVIDDFETNVYGCFDYIDEKLYTITRKSDYVPIPHTDGSGMVLPGILNKNAMFRAPFIKGLLGVFDFRKFIQHYGCSPIITDIYGKEHNVIDEDIQIIFTKSQFKMYKFYDSWDEYKDNFKKYRCGAGLCNIEEDRIKNAKLNYQMIQTLTNITDEELDILVSKSADKIKNISTSKETMLEVLGVTPYNNNMTGYQKSLKIYPQLLCDIYAKNALREMKDSLLKRYRSGKIEIYGKYTFVLPDFYAACEYWFLKKDDPAGLLNDGEVYCKLFKNSEKLDCLRSPHLYIEHPVRHNVANKVYGTRSEMASKWFTTNGIYTSVHDLISKVLQLDVDGDKLLVIADETFVKIAERNMIGVVPLYYNMQKAKSTEVNCKSIYKGLSAAFTGGNIGTYSNNITKIWNDDIFINGTLEEQEDAITCVKQLCCQNNFVIDYAKTLYKPEFPEYVAENIKKITSKNLPAFFEFAKEDSGAIAKRNKSVVNRLYEKIPNKSINTRSVDFGNFEYTKLMSNKSVICDERVSDLYDKLNQEYKYMFNMKDEYINNLHYVACEIRGMFNDLGYTDDAIVNMLIQYLYNNNKHKKHLFWFLYGHNVAENLNKNINPPKTKFIQCEDCGQWVEVLNRSKTTRCDNCQNDFNNKLRRIRRNNA